MTAEACSADEFSALLERIGAACAAAVDLDEVAALLEANGINDRVAAGKYGVDSVFGLASAVQRRIHRQPAQPAPPAPRGRTVLPALLRSVLYLTPTAAAAAVGGRLTGVPALATVGTLVLGWTLGQVLSYFGHATRTAAGVPAAARLVAVGFALLCTGWETILYAVGMPDRGSYLVAGAQLAMFASVAGALVTGAEGRLVLCAVPVWVASAALVLGARRYALTGLVCALAAMVVVAYLPALRRGTRWTWPPLSTVYPALGHGAVGGGQAVLFVIVAEGLAATGGLSAATVPLLLGVPMVEMAVAWHQRRVSVELSTVDSRGSFGRRLARVGTGTLAVLSVPVLLGAVLALAGCLPVASGVLLASVYAISLCCAAQRRLGVALLVVWCPAIPLALGPLALGRLGLPAPRADLVIPAVLLATCLPALMAAGLALTDPRGHR